MSKIATDLGSIIKEVEQYSDYHLHIDQDILLHILKHYQALVNLHAENCQEEMLLGIEKRKQTREKEEERLKKLGAIPTCKWCGALFSSSGEFCSSKCRDDYHAKGWHG